MELGTANNIAFATFLCQVVVEASQRCYTFDVPLQIKFCHTNDTNQLLSFKRTIGS